MRAPSCCAEPAEWEDEESLERDRLLKAGRDQPDQSSLTDG